MKVSCGSGWSVPCAVDSTDPFAKFRASGSCVEGTVLSWLLNYARALPWAFTLSRACSQRQHSRALLTCSPRAGPTVYPRTCDHERAGGRRSPHPRRRVGGSTYAPSLAPWAAALRRARPPPSDVGRAPEIRSQGPEADIGNLLYPHERAASPPLPPGASYPEEHEDRKGDVV